MRRVILFSAAVIASLAIVVSAALYQARQESSAVNTEPGDPGRIIALLTATVEGQLPQGEAVAFPNLAGTRVPHTFFPLFDGHANLACEACHTTGDYQGTDTTCYACHAADDAHAGQNGTSCETCHGPTEWLRVDFDHSTIGERDCVECHTPPADHYPGACRACHQDTTLFLQVSFNHLTLDVSDCSTCHAPPPNHYPGTCATCHLDTSNFLNAVFDHSTIGDQDCSACHAPPPNHYPGTCATCHLDTSNFLNAVFDHSTIGNQDCSACHAPPPNHFPGSCNTCHQDTTNFSNATFSHTFPLNHGGANGDCNTCHPGGNLATYTCTACHNQNEMVEEHADEGITDISNCVACHPTGEEDDDDDDNDDQEARIVVPVSTLVIIFTLTYVIPDQIGRRRGAVGS